MKPPLQAILLPNTSPKSTFSPAVRADNLLFLSGMTAVDENRQVVGVGDIVAQARFIYQKMGAVLAAAGVGFDAVIETTDYVTTFEGYEGTAALRREIFGKGPYPAATGVQVAGLVRKDALIEISAIAYVGAAQ